MTGNDDSDGNEDADDDMNAKWAIEVKRFILIWVNKE